MSSSSSNSAAIDQVTELRKTSPNILFIIARSKNQNIVVYEGKLKKTNELDAEKPVDVYWLDIDPEYQQANRKKGIMSDRSELNVLEQKFAYGLSWEAIADRPGAYRVKLVALPERQVVVWPEGDKVRAQIEINGQMVDVIRIYVNATDRMIGLPKVNYVELTGIDDKGQVVTEKVIPK